MEHADGRPAIGLVIEVPVYLASGGRLQLRAVLDDIGHAELPWPPDADEPDTLAVYDALGIRQQLGSQDKADGVWSLRPYGAAHGFVAASDGSRPESAVVGFYPAGGQPFWQFRPAGFVAGGALATHAASSHAPVWRPVRTTSWPGRARRSARHPSRAFPRST